MINPSSHIVKPVILHNKGYFLLEMMVSVVVIAICFNLCFSVFVTSNRMIQLNNVQIERTAESKELRGLFYKAVRHATGVVSEAGPYTTTEDVLVLHTPDAMRNELFTAIGNLKGQGVFCYAVLREVSVGEWVLDDFRTLSREWASLSFEMQSGSDLITLQLQSMPLSPDSTGGGARYVFKATPRLFSGMTGDTP